MTVAQPQRVTALVTVIWLPQYDFAFPADVFPRSKIMRFSSIPYCARLRMPPARYSARKEKAMATVDSTTHRYDACKHVRLAACLFVLPNAKWY